MREGVDEDQEADFRGQEGKEGGLELRMAIGGMKGGEDAAEMAAIEAAVFCIWWHFKVVGW